MDPVTCRVHTPRLTWRTPAAPTLRPHPRLTSHMMEPRTRLWHLGTCLDNLKNMERTLLRVDIDVPRLARPFRADQSRARLFPVCPSRARPPRTCPSHICKVLTCPSHTNTSPPRTCLSQYRTCPTRICPSHTCRVRPCPSHTRPSCLMDWTRHDMRHLFLAEFAVAPDS